MKVTELRIGNIVDLGVVNSIDADSISPNKSCIVVEDSVLGCREALLKEIEPIILTKKILLKFGFVIKNNETGCNSINIFCKKEDDEFNSEFIVLEQNGLIKISVTGFYYRIKTVHQLQNLYHSLTEKELFLS